MEGFAGVVYEVDVGEGRGKREEGRGEVGDPAGGEVGEAFLVDGGGYGKDVFGIAGVAAGHLDHGGEVGFDLAPAAAGEERDPGFGGVEGVVAGVVFAGDGGEGKFGEGMAYELGFDAAVFVERLFEGEDD